MRRHREAAPTLLLAAMLLIVGLIAGGGVLGSPRLDPSADAPRWYKGNTHTHSFWSDGNDFPEMIIDWYHQRDYDFVALSDHNVLSRGERWMAVDDVVRRARGRDVMEKYEARFGDAWIDRRTVEDRKEVRLRTLEEIRPLFESPGEFLLVEAEEITDEFDDLPVHVNAFNLAEVIPPPHGTSVRDTMRNILQAVREQEQRLGEPILAHLNHPNFGWGITAEDLAHVVEEPFFEVFNGHPGVRHQGDAQHPSVERLWDIANTIRLAELGAPPLFGLATDDAHQYHGRGTVSPGRGWIMVRAKELTPAALVEAMRRGDFYASSGVVLRSIMFSGNSRTLSIAIDPAPGATYTTYFIGTEIDFDRDREPVRDADGTPLPTTQRYSTDVGKILAEVRGTSARYTLTGNELYVRAMIISDRPPANPAFDDQREQAWTPPVGWEKHVNP
jgi:hypothetical protein